MCVGPWRAPPGSPVWPGLAVRVQEQHLGSLVLGVEAQDVAIPGAATDPRSGLLAGTVGPDFFLDFVVLDFLCSLANESLALHHHSPLWHRWLAGQWHMHIR